MDKLKKYIADNRTAFDTLEPNDSLWQKIERDTKIVPFTSKRWLNWRVAASIIVLLSMGYMVGKYWRPVAENNEIIGLSPKYGSELIQYATFIKDKKKELNKISSTSPELIKGFNQDLESLSGSYEELNGELPNNPNQEEILNRMIDNLQWQMEMLDQQLDIMKEKNNKKGDEFVQTEILNFKFSDEVQPILV
jgi:hypothetical protein